MTGPDPPGIRTGLGREGRRRVQGLTGLVAGRGADAQRRVVARESAQRGRLQLLPRPRPQQGTSLASQPRAHSRGLALRSDPSPVRQHACRPRGEAPPPASVLGKPGAGGACRSPSEEQASATSELRADHSWRQAGGRCHALFPSCPGRKEAAMPEAALLSFRPQTPPWRRTVPGEKGPVDPEFMTGGGSASTGAECRVTDRPRPDGFRLHVPSCLPGRFQRHSEA